MDRVADGCANVISTRIFGASHLEWSRWNHIPTRSLLDRSITLGRWVPGLNRKLAIGFVSLLVIMSGIGVVEDLAVSTAEAATCGDFSYEKRTASLSGDRWMLGIRCVHRNTSRNCRFEGRIDGELCLLGSRLFDPCYDPVWRGRNRGRGVAGLHRFEIDNIAPKRIHHEGMSVQGLLSWGNENSPISADILGYLDSIDGSTFSGCTSLTSMTQPNSVQSIGGRAFAENTAFPLITIPGSIISIGFDAFINTTSLISVYVDESNIVYSSINGVLFNKDMTALITCPEGKEGELAVPANVTRFGPDALAGCSGSDSISLSGDAPSVGGGWKDGCAGDLTAYYSDNATGFSTPSWNGLSAYPASARGSTVFPIDIALMAVLAVLLVICSLPIVISKRKKGR